MVSPDDVRYALGIIGNIISFGLFLSPVPTMCQIIKKKSVEEFSVFPYIATLLNCAMWVIYVLCSCINVTHKNTFVVTINGVGVGIEAIYVAIFFVYSSKHILTRKKIYYGLLFDIAFTAVVVPVTYFAFHSMVKRTIFVGAVCVVFNIFMYFSPLTVAYSVIKTKSVKYMPFWLSLANFLNGACWTAYACINNQHTVDPWLVIPNGLGALAGLVQLILYACFYGSTNWNDPEPPSGGEKPPKTPPPTVELKDIP